MFGSAIILGFVEAVRDLADHPCWWLDPGTCALKGLSFCVQGTIGALTRFALIAHLFHGDGLCHVATITEGMLKRHLPGAVFTGFLANTLMYQMAMGLSTGYGFLVWYCLDMENNLGIFRGLMDFLSENTDSVENARSSQLLVAMLTWTMYLGTRRPITTLFWSCILLPFSGLLDSWMHKGFFQSYLIAQGMAAIASIIFGYMGAVMEYATDTVFYCMAVEAENGQADARTLKLQDLVQKQLEDEVQFAGQRHARADGQSE